MLQAEIDRLDLQHHIFRLTFNDQICLCPKRNGAKRVLDLGTGTGIWSIDYGMHAPSNSGATEQKPTNTPP